VELLVALTLGGWILGGVVVFLIGSVRWADRVSDRAEALELARTVWMILDAEVRPGIPGRDWTLTSERALELRAYRGVARVCGQEDNRWAVAHRGLRAPDPDRDSVLVLGMDGGWRAADLEGSWAGGGSCALDPGEEARLMRWSGSGDVDPVLVRVFERGRYSLEDGSFRYRRGAGGRQPLTPDRVGAGSRFDPEPPGFRIVLELDGRTTADPGTRFEWRLSPAELPPP